MATPGDRSFPIQEPLRNKEEVRFARELLRYLWTEYVDKGQQLVFTVDRKIDEPSKKQRGGCMLWFADMAKEMNVTPNEARLFCMHEFFSPVITTVRDEEIVSLRSFGDLSKAEVTDLMDQMTVFCAEEGIPLRTLKEQ